jgi:integrase/recombinase XerD
MPDVHAVLRGAMGEVESFLSDHQDRRGVGERTIANYRERLRILATMIDLDELAPASFRALADDRAWSAATRASYWATCRAFTAWRHRVGLNGTDPFAGMKAPEPPPPNPKPVGRDDLARLLALAQDRPRKASWPVDEWATLAAYAGLRCNEIAALRREQLHRGVNGWELEIEGKGGTRASIPVGPEVVKFLEKRKPGRVYPTATTDDVIEAGRRLFRRAGLSGGLHRLRHSYATAIYQQTRDPFTVQRLCRHRSLVSTLAYAQVVDAQLREAIGGLHAA